VNLDTPSAEADSDEIGPGGPDPSGESSHMASLGEIDRVDGVTGAGDRPHLDCHPGATVPGEEIDLAGVDGYVPSLDDQTVLGEPTGRDRLARRTCLDAVIAQSLSSVFSSFSTLTSRNVSTWTFSRTRAGRNMTQTQASVKVTSKYVEPSVF
jgi:hypothetical protein